MLYNFTDGWFWEKMYDIKTIELRLPLCMADTVLHGCNSQQPVGDSNKLNH
jgi:hypothetical protein